MTKSSVINAYHYSFFVYIVFLWNKVLAFVCNVNSRKAFILLYLIILHVSNFLFVFVFCVT